MTKILIVDDDDTARKLMKLIVLHLHEDVTILEADNGTDAIDLVLTQSPDIVLLDRMIPGLLGLEVLQLIKGSPNFSHIKVALISGMDTERDKEVGLDLFKADAYFVKPFSVREIAEWAKSHLHQKSENALI